MRLKASYNEEREDSVCLTISQWLKRSGSCYSKQSIVSIYLNQ